MTMIILTIVATVVLLFLWHVNTPDEEKKAHDCQHKTEDVPNPKDYMEKF